MRTMPLKAKNETTATTQDTSQAVYVITISPVFAFVLQRTFSSKFMHLYGWPGDFQLRGIATG